MGGSVGQARDEPIGRTPEPGVEARRLEPAQRREAGGHCDRIARQRARLVDGAERRDVLHDLAAATEGTHRHAAADDLAERRQVGPDAVECLGAALRNAEPGHHLVEDQHGAVLRALLAQSLEEAGHGRDAIHVACHRLDDHAGDVRPDFGEGGTHLRGIVVGERHGVRGELRRHAGGRRHAERQHARAGLDQQRVGVAVVAALELDDLVALRVTARQPDRAHRRLGARAAHAHQLDRRHQLDDLARDDGLELGRRAEREPVDGGLLHGLDHGRVGVAQDHWSPGAHVVDEFPAVGGPRARALGLGEENRLATHAAKGANGRIDAAGNVLAGFGEQAHGWAPTRQAAA